MKRSMSLFLLLVGIVLVWVTGCAAPATAEPTATPIPPTPTPSILDIASNLHWSGVASILYQGSVNIYFDPVTISGNPPPADIILITHGHIDHWSAVDLVKIIGPQTTLIISPNVSNAYEADKDMLGIPATVLEEGQSIEVNGVTIEAVPAYGRGHPQGNGGVGYIVSVDSIRIYHAGGTAAYPEMANYNVDIALIPLYTLDTLKAMVEILPAKVIIPVHTDAFTAPLIADYLVKNVGGEKQYIGLEIGPFEP